MPIAMLRAGEEAKITRITGKDDTKRFLESLGFVVGSTVRMVSELGGSVIISVKDSRIALDKAMAMRVFV